MGRSRSGERWIERPTGDDRLEGGQERLALLAQGCQVASDPGERCCPRVAAEAVGDLLLNLEPAQIPLRLVVVEGNRQVVEEGQHRRLVEQEASKQVAGGRLRQASALPRPAGGSRRRGTGGQSGGEQLAVAAAQGRTLGGRRLGESLAAGLVGRRVHRSEQVLEVLGPGLLVLLFQEGEFAPAKRRWCTLHSA